MEFSNRYVVMFATILCLVCALVVSSLAVGLKEPQQRNAQLFKAKNVLLAAGVIEDGQVVSQGEVEKFFEQIQYVVIDRESGAVLEGEDPNALDLKKMAKDKANSIATAREFKNTLVKRIPNKLVAYEVNVPGHESLVMPVSGYGLWSVMQGYLAVSPNGREVMGITFYEHGETAGLGGEIENPEWKAQFPGQLALDSEGNVKIEVVKKGQVKEPSYQVDGISGATITSVGVSLMLKVWLGDSAYGPYLAKKNS